MTIPIAINGFGRMGRLLVRSLTQHPELELVHINEHRGGLAAAAHLTQFDSVHGRWEYEATVVENELSLNGQIITFSEFTEPSEVPWSDRAGQIIIDCTGSFRTVDALSS